VRIDGYLHELVPIDTTIRVAVFEDGRMAIAQRQTFDVRFFSADGEPIGSIGREGQGPGEFTNVWRLGWIADTLYAYDFSQRRFTLIDPQLNYVRYIYVPNGARPSAEMAGTFPEFQVVYGGALYADGSVYGELAGARTPGLGNHEVGKPTYGRIAEDGTILSYFQFATGPDIEPIQIEVQIPNGGGTAMGLVMPTMMTMPDRPILRLADNGTRMAHLQVSMEGPNAGTYEIFMEDVFDGPLYTRRYPFDAVPITPQMQDSLLAERLEEMDEAIANVYREHAIFPPMMPPVVGLVHGADDRLWIRMADTPAGRPYRILDPMGEPEGTLVLPLRSRIAVADATHVWVIEEDEFEVESVVRYRLVSEADP
jgi:hypothetical protein